MAKDKKNKKPQVMSLHDFVGPNAGQSQGQGFDWARDEPEPEEEAEATPGVPRVSYARTAGNMGNFRDAVHTSSKIVDYNMERPYLGFVANLLTNLPEAEVRAFFADANINIESIKMNYKERSTFAFIEYATPQDLQMAILLEGKFLKNRPIKVDIATQEQREKMMNDKARQQAGRDPKSPNSGGFGSFDRDTMGTEQRSFTSLGGDRRGPRSNTSANAPRDFSDFSRDTMGGAQPDMTSEFGGSSNGNRRTPNTASPTMGGGFPNFRDADRVEQPTMERRMPRQSSRDNVGKGEGGNWRGSKAASPTTRTEGGSWRDQPAAEQPSADRRPKREEKEKAPLQLGGEAQPEAPKKDLSVPKAAAPPKTSAWGGDAGDRFAAFRK